MDQRVAMAKLGLTGTEDVASITRRYGECLSDAQQALVDARTDADRQRAQVELAQLVEAYQVLTQSGVEDKDCATEVRLPESAPPVMRPGIVLSDRFAIKSLLGQGGMGNVYAAHDRLKQQDVAIKVLRQDLLSSPGARERFLAEAKVSCDLSHPNIVRVYDVGSSEGYYYLSMELLKGCTLRQRMHSSGRLLSIEAVTDIATQLIGALRHAHRSIVHRDIKPENIWLTEDGTLKLMDFGIARAYSTSNLTMTGMSLGTAYYMAPEQRAAAKEVDWRADQYSLGIVLYELLTGSVPMGAAKSLRELRPDLPKRYAYAVMRAIEPRPQERFDSMSELLAELQAPRPKSLQVKVALIAAGAVLSVLAVPAMHWERSPSVAEAVSRPPPIEVPVAASAPLLPELPLAVVDPAMVAAAVPEEMPIDTESLAAMRAQEGSVPGDVTPVGEPAGEADSKPSAWLEQTMAPAALPEPDPPPLRDEPLPPRDDALPPPPPMAGGGVDDPLRRPPSECHRRCQRVEGDCHQGVLSRRDQCARGARTMGRPECRAEARRGELQCLQKGRDCRSTCR